MRSEAVKLLRRSGKPAFFLISGSTFLLWSHQKSEILRNDDGGRNRNLQDQSNERGGDSTRLTSLEDDQDATWSGFSARLKDTNVSLSKIGWGSIGEDIASKVIPRWAKMIPDYITKLQGEMEMYPTSLANEIWREAQDPYCHPEITLGSKVRLGKGLCNEEIQFAQRRKIHTTRALARYLEIPESEIDPQDVPTIAICGSGGGLRALVAGASSCLSAQKNGLYDCVTYTAGVSGSCWLQALYNSSLSGRQHEKIIEHLKSRLGTHIAYPPAFLELMTRAPTNKYILSGTVEKLKSDSEAAFGLVDIYGILLATRLMVPRDELTIDDRDLKLSNQRRFLEQGENPMPIYAAVRHEIPVEEVSNSHNVTENAIDAIDQAKKKAWFQWFELTPYELGCEEIEAAIPSWSIGRHYNKGESKRMENGISPPELRISFLMGIWGSAFCATLAHYYKEVRPLLKDLAGFKDIDDLIEGQNEELTKLHPVDPGQVPNYALGLQGMLPASCPESIFKDRYLNLMDAGMSNNLPIYPLLRREREVDVIICFDASADIEQENWLSLVDGYAKEHQVTRWPKGVGWPKEEKRINMDEAELLAADSATTQQVALEVNDSKEKTFDYQCIPKAPAGPPQSPTDMQNGPRLGFCNVWVGEEVPKIFENDPPGRKRLLQGEEWQLRSTDPGITVIYLPFLPNPKVEGVDPNSSTFMSTWNFVYSPEQIDKVVSLAKANFDEGQEKIKQGIRAVYEKKKARRLNIEAMKDIRMWKTQLRNDGDHFL